MLQGVIFDFDGIIIDSEPIHFIIEMQIFKELGIDISEEEYQQFLGISERDTYNQIKVKYGIDFDSEEILETKINRFVQYINRMEHMPVIPGIVELIKDLYTKQIKLGIGSSGTKEIASTVLKKLDILHMFSSIVCGSDVKNTKPHPDIFEKAVNELHVNKNSCLVVEDAENGILAAHRAGLKVVGFRKNGIWGNQDAQPDFKINNFTLFDTEKITHLI